MTDLLQYLRDLIIVKPAERTIMLVSSFWKTSRHHQDTLFAMIDMATKSWQAACNLIYTEMMTIRLAEEKQAGPDSDGREELSVSSNQSLTISHVSAVNSSTF